MRQSDGPASDGGSARGENRHAKWGCSIEGERWVNFWIGQTIQLVKCDVERAGEFASGTSNVEEPS